MNRQVLNELNDIYKDYLSLPSFIEKYNNINSIEFDYQTVNSFSLFLVDENYNFKEVNAILDKIDYVMPSIKRIFAKPIIHLTDENEVLPVEAVRLINNDTIHHIGSHSELIGDINENGIKPIKLLTKTYKDNYSIYENIVFVKAVNSILNYLRHNMRDLRNLLYSSETLQFNILERVNHINYYMAIGKLHTGYIRNLTKYYDITKSTFDRMNVMYETLTQRLKRNVYRLNKDYKGNFRLHNSNILHMQKDYHRVYVLLKYFKSVKLLEEDIPTSKIVDFKNNYLSYLKLITIFSIMHFNFKTADDVIINYDDLDVTFTFNKWKLKLKQTHYKTGLILECKKDKTYKIALVPTFYENTIDDKNINEVILVTPFTEEKDNVFLSISNIDSFRRIQQILQKLMINTDKKFDTCMFCGETLINASTEDNRSYYCKSCRTVIKECTCKETNEKYYRTEIDNYKIKNTSYNVDTSELLHYRNITPINVKGEFICPICHKIHKE